MKFIKKIYDDLTAGKAVPLGSETDQIRVVYEQYEKHAQVKSFAEFLMFFCPGLSTAELTKTTATAMATGGSL